VDKTAQKTAYKYKYYCPDSRRYQYGLIGANSRKFFYLPRLDVFSFVPPDSLQLTTKLDLYLYY
jgi:hypothetical protein